jgi:hypothetical protein
MSVGHLLNDGTLELKGSSSSVEFSAKTSSTKWLLLQFKPYFPGQNIYWLDARLTSKHAILAMSSVTTVDYDIMHRRFAHPSKDVLRHASGNTKNFPSNMSFPSNDPVCKGCAEGKMTRSSFPPSPGRSKAPFDKVHMDLKEFSIQSYNKYKFFILFFDDCTSFGWIVLLRHKSETDPTIRQFIAMVKNQFNKVIHEFMIDAGGEFKSEGLRTFLKELGINTLTSVPHMHQQNGHAERFIRTIVEKAQAIRLEACIPQNWWKFAVNYAVHVYNRTPLKCSSSDYKTPFERLHRTKPDVAHLRVFGCGAYVFLPEDVQNNNLSPRSELMTFIGLPEGTKGYIFMRSPNNIVFTAIQALFDETLFPKCPNMRRPGYTPVDLPPDDLHGEHNGPPDDENEDYGGGLPPIPVGPAGGQVPWQHMQPQQPPMQPPQQQQYPAYPPLPPSHPSTRSSSPLSYTHSPPHRVLTPAPSPPPRYPSPDYDRNFFNSYQEYLDWLEQRNAYRPPTPESEEVRQRKVRETLKHWGYGQHEGHIKPPVDYTDDGYIIPPVEQIPVPQLPPQPQEGPSGSQPRRSGRERRPVVRPDNVYGSRNPTQSEQMSNREFREIIDDVPAPSGSGNRPDSPPYEGKGKKRADFLVNHMVREGGADLIKFLLRAAVSSAPAKGKIPEVSKVREWQFRDLMRLPKASQEEWKIACKEELEALHQRNVFKLTDLPKGRKTIGC